MHAIMLILTLAAAPHAHDPPDPFLPLPLAATRPEEGGFVLYGGPLYGGIGAGWRFRDGSRVDVGPRGVAYSRTLHETEWTRYTTVSGSRPGAGWEVYLGQGFAVESGAGRMAAIWYPWECLTLSFGADLLTGRRGWGWQVSF